MDRALARDWSDPPKGRGVGMAQRRARPSCENGSHPSAFPAQSGVPNRINPAMDAVEPTRLDADAHLGPREPKCIELAYRDHAVLRYSQFGDAHIRAVWGTFAGHMTGNAPRGLVRPVKTSHPRRTSK
jgi:hypothetical protein